MGDMKTKICTKCGKELPATAEYFRRAQSGIYGLRSGCKECDNQYYEVNKEILIEKRKRYYQENKAIFNAHKKKYRQDHAEAHRESTMRYKQGHKEQARVSDKKRDARKREVLSTLTIEQWERAKQYFNNQCCYCGSKLSLQQEHFIPLSRGGEYTVNNIIPACMSCNASKKDRDFFTWYHEHEGYDKRREHMLLDFLGYKGNIQQTSLAI